MLKKDKMRLALISVVVIVSAITVFPITGRVKLGLDLRGGAHIVLQAKPTEENPLSSEKELNDSMERLVAVLRNRIDQYGIVEPQIHREGGDRVAVDLPGVDDPDAAIELIGRTAVLEFRKVANVSPPGPPPVRRDNYPTQAAYEEAQQNWARLNENTLKQIAAIEEQVKENPRLTFAKDEEGRAYVLSDIYVTGKDLVGAEMTFDEFGKPAVSLEFNKSGSTAFEAATGANIDKQIAIVLDDAVISAPVVRNRISGGKAQISGNFSRDEAARLAVMLRAGALPVAVDVIENRSVGPSLGEDSIRMGVRSGLVGAALVAVFMLIYYGMLGIAADIAMMTAMLMLMALMIAMRVTLTLPGIGGIILTIGMAVDGNILIYERMREEFRSGKTVMAALDSGFRKALTVIVDSNVTTLIAGAVLFYFGTGPVRGFAVTLSLGVLTAMFGNLVVTRAILQIMLRKRKGLAL